MNLEMLKTKEERQTDLNPQETSEWLEALEQVLDEAGPDRAHHFCAGGWSRFRNGCSRR